jgi:ethanolamine transporter EutH
MGGILLSHMTTQDWHIWLRAWPLLPGMAGLGMIFENLRNVGWRFSNRQAWLLIAGSIVMTLIVNIPVGGFLVRTYEWVDRIASITGEWRRAAASFMFMH